MAELKNTDLFRTLFVSARDQYDAGLRRAGLLLTVAAVFHVAVFMSYINAHQSIVDAKSLQQTLDQQFTGVTEIRTELDKVDRTIKIELRKLLDLHLNNLVEDFQRLSESLVAVQSGEEQPGMETRGELPQLQSQQIQHMYIQQMLPEAINLSGIEGITPITLLPEPVIKMLHQRASFEEVREALLPHINATIIQPRFTKLNAEWRDHTFHRIVPRLARINQLVSHGKVEIPEEMARWQSLDAASKLIDDKLVQHTFTPPSGNNWWRTVGDKGAALIKVEEFALDNLNQGMHLGSVSLEIGSALKTSLDQQQVLIQKMQEEIEVAEKRFEEQSAMLAELGSGFRAVALDLGFVVRWFPLLLGVLFAYISLTLGQRLLVYRKTANLLEVDSPQGIEILVPLAHNPLQSGRRLFMDASARAILACGWILIAGWQLSLWVEIDRTRVFVLTIVSLVITLAAQLNRYRTLKPLVEAPLKAVG